MSYTYGFYSFLLRKQDNFFPFNFCYNGIPYNCFFLRVQIFAICLQNRYILRFHTMANSTAIYGDCLRLDVTWSGIYYTQRSANNSKLFFFKLSDRLSDKLEGFTGQIWNLPEISSSLASFPIYGRNIALPLQMQFSWHFSKNIVRFKLIYTEKPLNKVQNIYTGINKKNFCFSAVTNWNFINCMCISKIKLCSLSVSLEGRGFKSWLYNLTHILDSTWELR